jgi:hypothetical protein
MRRRSSLAAGSAGVALAMASLAGAAGSRPVRLEFSTRNPLSGRLFVGLVAITDESARDTVRLATTMCTASVSKLNVAAVIPPRSGTRVATATTTFPSGATVPRAVVFAWKVPARSVGKYFYVTCNSHVVFTDGTASIADGFARKWVIRR